MSQSNSKFKTQNSKFLQLNSPSLYAAFDVFPSRKGAAIHINQFSRALFEKMNGGLLYVLGNEKMPLYQIENNVEIVRFYAPFNNYLERAIAFSNRLNALIVECESSLKLCHFRDIWSGVSILEREHKYKTIFEVNAFPSIELIFTYNIAPETLLKIREQEKFCLNKCDQIITPSHSLKEKVLSYGVRDEKVTVIPNGANILKSAQRPVDAPQRYIIYFGALQAWQGVDVLLRAFARLADLRDLHLVICASHYSRRAKMLEKFAEKLGVNERVVWRYNLNEEQLAPWREHALLSVAPLTECSRNIEQGCAPLKILESMASGVPVVASDFPSVREILADGEHGRLINPDRPGELARVIRVLVQYPEKLKEMGERARKKIEAGFLWRNSTDKLIGLYEAILDNRKPQ